MRFYIKQKVFSWKTRFNVFDEAHNPVYKVVGKFFSFTKKLTIYENGNEVAFIKEKFFCIRPKYEIYIGGELVTEIEKKFTFLRHEFNFSHLNWRIDGNWMSHDYTITNTQTNRLVASISKAFFSWGDSYNIEISEMANPVLCIAALIVIDMIVHENRSSGLEVGLDFFSNN